jgi:hypothetical protein
MPDERPARQVIQNLGLVRFHARAFTGREDDAGELLVHLSQS